MKSLKSMYALHKVQVSYFAPFPRGLLDSYPKRTDLWAVYFAAWHHSDLDH